MKKSILAIVAALIWGCATTSQPGELVGPSRRASITFSAWSYDGRPARTVHTDHYIIYTTLEDREFLQSVAQVMEGALEQYQRLTPGVPLTDRPMYCYIFSRRPEWAQFTIANTGPDAAVYLKINRGAYTIGDRFVAYFIGDVGSYAVAAHEGWHQYVARHFRSRLPPFLEEGIAAMFENIRWSSDLPRWNLSFNPARVAQLQDAVRENRLLPLEKLCTMHAGDVVSQKDEQIEAFYAQNWAFAQFLWNAENGRYRPMFQKMLADLASGQADQWTGRVAPPHVWDRRTVRPLLEHYLGMNIHQIDTAYQQYIRKLASSSRQS